jgi:hypothetical protein
MRDATRSTSAKPSDSLPQFPISPRDIEWGDADKTLKRRAVTVGSSGDGTGPREIGAEDILEEIAHGLSHDAARDISQEITRRMPEEMLFAELSSPAATQEVQVRDILEVVDALPRQAARPRQEAPRHEARRDVVTSSVPATLRPVALEVPLPAYQVEASVDIDWEVTPLRRRRHAGVVAGVLAVAVAIVAAGLVRRGVSADVASFVHRGASEETRETRVPVVAAAPVIAPAAAPPPPALSAAPPRAESSAPPPSPATPAIVPAVASPSSGAGAGGGVPVVDIASLPRPQTGTILGAPNHRLFVDGHLARSPSVVVHCGSHAVRVGSAGKTRMIDVPCGSEVSVR